MDRTAPRRSDILIIFPLSIVQIKNDGDRNFMEDVFLAYRSLMYWFANKYAHSPQDVDDIVNIANERLCNKISTMRDLRCNALRAYVVSTIKRTAFNLNSKNSNYAAHLEFLSDEAFENTPALDDAMEDYVLHKIAVTDLRDAIPNLPPREKEVILMKFYDCMSSREIAEELGIQETTVRATINRARTHILKELISKKRIDEDELPH
jgi:RNA polymerase sigma factor (sigma-70 family)